MALQNFQGGTGSEVVGDIINKGFVAQIVQQLDDMIHLDRNTRLLEGSVERIKNHLQDISDGFENQQRVTPTSITSWVKRLRDAIGNSTQLITASQGQQSGLDWIKKFRQVRVMNKEFEQLLQDLQTDFSILASHRSISATLPQSSAPAPPQSAESAPSQETDALLHSMPEHGLVFWAIESVEFELQRWINAEVRRIGVYGMPGVGKTTVLKRVYNSYKVSPVFDVVIWITVSLNPKISDLQSQIAEAIDLDLSKTFNLDTRKMKLSASLKEKKFLLILDDMWSALDLEELGVDFGTDKGSKVVFSTRNRGLASTEADESTEVKPLTLDQGWELFQRVAFKCGPVPDDLKKCAREIADECEGLPLAITVVAKTMKSKKRVESEWITCLSMMKITDPSFPNTHDCVDKGLYQKLRLSYTELAKASTPNLQNCFLYCAMYPEDEKIWVEELVRMWIAEGFVKSKEATYSKDIQLGHRYVELLIESGLFQSVNFEKQSMGINVNKPVKVWKKRFITVHDVIRDMAILIAEEKENYLCRAGLELEDFSLCQTQDCKRMSLRRTQRKSLPEDLHCTQLVSLILSENPLRSLPTSLTHSLIHLRVLDLSYSQIESLPEDIQCTQLVSLILSENPLRSLPSSLTHSLIHLRFLDLSYTQIESVPTSLTRLEFLAMRHTCIKELPKDIGNLSNLQLLDISECKYLTSLPTEISQLSALKRLHLSMGMENAVKDPTNVIALKGLKKLKELHLFMFFKFEEHEIMGTIMGSWVEMTHLYLNYNHMDPVKCNLPWQMQNMKKLKSLVLSEYRGTSLPNWVCEFQHLERLDLNSCNNVKELPSLEKLINLKFLKLRNYSNVRDLGIGRIGIQSRFPKLEMLHLSEMPKLRSIGVLDEGTLSKLRVLKVKKCPQLRKLPKGMENLSNLKVLYGHKISWWEKIIWEDDNMKIFLHKLFKEI